MKLNVNLLGVNKNLHSYIRDNFFTKKKKKRYVISLGLQYQFFKIYILIFVVNFLQKKKKKEKKRISDIFSSPVPIVIRP